MLKRLIFRTVDMLASGCGRRSRSQSAGSEKQGTDMVQPNLTEEKMIDRSFAVKAVQFECDGYPLTCCAPEGRGMTPELVIDSPLVGRVYALFDRRMLMTG